MKQSNARENKLTSATPTDQCYNQINDIRGYVHVYLYNYTCISVLYETSVAEMSAFGEVYSSEY